MRGLRLKVDEEFLGELGALSRDFVGRPTPITRAQRLSEQLGYDIWLKREDLAHTGAHKINNALGQALIAKRLGKERIIAETGAGQHGVASATACALLGLPCVVYMGEEDIRRQAPNVARMKLLGTEVVPVTAGTRTLKEAVNEALRDWAASVTTTHYIIGSVVGPHPFPGLVRDLQRVIGDEARAQYALEAGGGDPGFVLACVGGGSNAIGMFTAFVGAPGVELIGVEAGGRGPGLGEHCSSITQGQPGVLHGALSYLLQDEVGQIVETHSISAGLDYPGVGTRACLAQRRRPRPVRVGDRRGRAGGIPGIGPNRGHPAGPRARARDRLAPVPAASPWLAGPGVPVRPGRQGPRHRPVRAGRLMGLLETTLRDVRGAGHRAFVPYLTGGFPGVDVSVLQGLQAAGADAVEVGIPFSDPVMDGGVIQEASRRSLEAGTTPDDVFALIDEAGLSIPVAVMTYVNPVVRLGIEAFLDRARDAGVSGIIVPDVPVDEADQLCGEAAGRGVDAVLLAAPGSAPERLDAIAGRSHGFIYCVATYGVTGARDELSDTARSVVESLRPRTDLPLLAGVGIATPDQAADACTFADGVIVGSALMSPMVQGEPDRMLELAARFFDATRVG